MVSLDVRVATSPKRQQEDNGPAPRPASQPVTYEVGEGGFLVGSVPGCDLRLPGSNLPPLLCLVSLQPTGASVRKLAPVLPLLVNDRAVVAATLQDGDRITVGPAEVLIHIRAEELPQGAVGEQRQSQALSASEEAPPARRGTENDAAPAQGPGDAASVTGAQEVPLDLVTLSRSHLATLSTEVARLRELEQQLESAHAELATREEAHHTAQVELAAARAELDGQRLQAQRQQEEVQAQRQELHELRQQLSQRFQVRRDRLLNQQQAVRRAGRKLQERKRRLDDAEAQFLAQQQAFEAKRATEHDLWQQHERQREGDLEQISREREVLEEQHRLLASRQQEWQRDLAERTTSLEERDRRVSEQGRALEQAQKQHQADLVRLDRIQGHIEQKFKKLQQHALEVDRRYEQLQRDGRELEAQAAQLDEWHNRVVHENRRLEQDQATRAQANSQLEQRAAALEGQQAMLATLRARMERMRDELTREELAVSDQRALQEAREQDLKERQDQAQRDRIDLDNERDLFVAERRRFEERQGALEAAVTQLRQAREALVAEEAALRLRDGEIEASAASQAEAAALLAARTTQLEETERAHEASREALRERSAALSRAEQALAALQEQVRRRSEELSSKAIHNEAEELRLAAEAARLVEQLQAIEARDRSSAETVAAAEKEVAAKTSLLQQQQQELVERETALRTQMQRAEDGQTALMSRAQALATERLAWEVEKQQAQHDLEQKRAALAAARAAVAEVSERLPELEGRAEGAAARLMVGREQLRASLAELSDYAQAVREGIEAPRRSNLSEAERLRQQELALNAGRDEHRVAVAAFRQQIVEWQGLLTEMRRALAQGESEIDRRQAEVEARAREVEDASARLAEQGRALQMQQRVVQQRRGEVDRHLVEMREWYRKKIREIAGLPPATDDGLQLTEEDSDGPSPPSITPDQSPEEEVGAHLQALGLIDADTLAALLLEARRQRRSLRQVLLGGGYLTLYQMALIEAGNLSGLVLGPVRVIDRLQATSREAVYRVFDPRRNTEALLRHLAESEMEDAVRPDEFRQRFTAALAVRHPNVAATLEVLEIQDRPAVLQEWATGTPSTEWPPLAAAPGVWFRLMSQATLALATVHEAGLVHGHLHAASFVVVPEGKLLLCGVGESRWLAVPPPQEDGEPSPTADLTALGHIATGWAATAAPGSKAKPLPAPLAELLRRLRGEDTAPTLTARELLEELDRAGADIPANTAAWERFVRLIQEEAATTPFRQSA
jgi:chromosome segregation ATPase